MFIPVGTDAQRIWQVDKDANGEVSQKALLDVRVSVRLVRSTLCQLA